MSPRSCSASIALSRGLGAALLSACVACGEDDASRTVDPAAAADVDAGAPSAFDPSSVEDGSEPLFEADRLLHIELELPPDTWSALGREGRLMDAAGCGDGFDAGGFEYTYFPADLTVDGNAVGNVGVRKKGFLGSLMITRPSLKVDFDRFDATVEVEGLGRLTLNNNRQDPEQVRQCVTYMLFRKAGVPAPRCNFAKVTVNGDDLGTYSHVESIGRRFLRRRFSNASGNLYEGQGADFVRDQWEQLQVKTNEATNDRSDVRALTEALTVDDTELLDALAPLIDVDRFLTYWAMEALTASWDSYSTLKNNYWIYDDPDSGFEFIPWGTDASMSETGLSPGQRVQHVSVDGALSGRLYALPEIRERYVARLRKLLDEVWDADAIIAQIDAWEALVGDANAAGIEEIREFVRRRPEIINAEIDGGVEGQPSPVSPCFLPGPPISGTFSGVWQDDASAPPSATASATLVVDGASLPLAESHASGRLSDAQFGGVGPSVQISGTRDDGGQVTLSLGIEPRMYGVGEIPLHAFSNVGFLLNFGSTSGAPPFGFVTDGVIRLDEAGQAAGEPVSGSFEGHVYSFGGPP